MYIKIIIIICIFLTFCAFESAESMSPWSIKASSEYYDLSLQTMEQSDNIRLITNKSPTDNVVEYGHNCQELKLSCAIFPYNESITIKSDFQWYSGGKLVFKSKDKQIGFYNFLLCPRDHNKEYSCFANNKITINTTHEEKKTFIVRTEEYHDKEPYYVELVTCADTVTYNETFKCEKSEACNDALPLSQATECTTTVLFNSIILPFSKKEDFIAKKPLSNESKCIKTMALNDELPTSEAFKCFKKIPCNDKLQSNERKKCYMKISCNVAILPSETLNGNETFTCNGTLLTSEALNSDKTVTCNGTLPIEALNAKKTVTCNGTIQINEAINGDKTAICDGTLLISETLNGSEKFACNGTLLPSEILNDGNKTVTCIGTLLYSKTLKNNVYETVTCNGTLLTNEALKGDKTVKCDGILQTSEALCGKKIVIYNETEINIEELNFFTIEPCNNSGEAMICNTSTTILCDETVKNKGNETFKEVKTCYKMITYTCDSKEERLVNITQSNIIMSTNEIRFRVSYVKSGGRVKEELKKSASLSSDDIVLIAFCVMVIANVIAVFYGYRVLRAKSLVSNGGNNSSTGIRRFTELPDIQNKEV